jgi:hypothetical protein
MENSNKKLVFRAGSNASLFIPSAASVGESVYNTLVTSGDLGVTKNRPNQFFVKLNA